MDAEEDAILSRLELLKQYKTQLLAVPANDFREYDQNILVHKATERLLQTSIEACLDIGKHIIAQSASAIVAYLKRPIADEDKGTTLRERRAKYSVRPRKRKKAK